MPGTNNYSRLDGQDLEQNVQQPQSTVDVAPATTGTPEPVYKPQPAASSYDDIISSIQSEMDKMENKHKEEQKVDAVVAAIDGIGDMGRAIGNIYATTKYVPSAFDPKETASAKYGERAAKAREAYQKDRREMMQYLDKYKKANSDFHFNQEKVRVQQAQEAQKLALRGKELELRAEKMLTAKNEAEWMHNLEESKLALQQRRLDIQAAYSNKLISLEQYRAENDRLKKIDNRLVEYEENYEYDKKSGKVTKKIMTVNKTDGTTTSTTSTSGNVKKKNPMS